MADAQVAGPPIPDALADLARSLVASGHDDQDIVPFGIAVAVLPFQDRTRAILTLAGWFSIVLALLEEKHQPGMAGAVIDQLVHGDMVPVPLPADPPC